MTAALRSYDDERLRDLAVELTRQAADEQSRAAQTQRQARQAWAEVKRRKREDQCPLIDPRMSRQS